VLEVNKRSTVVLCVDLTYIIGLAEEAGADFTKTCTSFRGGATVEDVVLMRCTVGPNVEMKVAGEMKTLIDAQSMVIAGATRLGASAGVQIAQGAQV
jgi:deoxyribose-phosphate aldolase